MRTRTYKLTCQWHDETTYLTAVNPEAALRAYCVARNLSGVTVGEAWGAEDGEPAGGFASFTGQTWANGDYNIESVYAEEVDAHLALA